jgi:signal transduction histidine kinase
MRSATLGTGSSTAAEGDELASFYAHLANGLHAMAQPLTILRSVVAASTLSGLTAIDHRRYLDISSDQVERACVLFHSLQQLVAARQIEAECAPVDLSRLLEPVVEDQKAILQASGVDMKVVIPDALPLLLADMDRTLQALFAVLKIAAAVSSPGDAVELLVSPRNESMELVIQNRNAHKRRLNSSEHLSLALAEANIRSQQGEYECVEDPFRVSMTLLVQDIDPVNSQDASHGARALQFH